MFSRGCGVILLALKFTSAAPSPSNRPKNRPTSFQIMMFLLKIPGLGVVFKGQCDYRGNYRYQIQVHRVLG